MFEKFWKSRINKYFQEAVVTDRKIKLNILRDVKYCNYTLITSIIVASLFLAFYQMFSMSIFANSCALLIYYFYVRTYSERITRITASRFKAEILRKIVPLSYIFLLILGNGVIEDPWLLQLLVLVGWFLYPSIELYWHIQLFANARGSGRKTFKEQKKITGRYFLFIEIFFFIGFTGNYLFLIHPLLAGSTLKLGVLRFFIGFISGSLLHVFFRDGYDVLQKYR